MRSPTSMNRSVGFGGLIFTENINGPSQVVAILRSVVLWRIYSSISLSILMETFSGIELRLFFYRQISFYFEIEFCHCGI